MKISKVFAKDIDKISKVKTPKELFFLLKNEISAFLEVSRLGIFILDDSEMGYALSENIARIKGMSGDAMNTKFSLGDPVIEHLIDVKRAILTNEVNRNFAVALTEDRKISLCSLKDRLNELGVEICVPGFTQDKLVVVFLLWEKISKEEFSSQEVEFFSLFVERSAKMIYDVNLLKKEVKLFIESIRKINNALEAKDTYTRGHSNRVAQFSLIVGRKLFDEFEDIPYGEIVLYYAAEFHDVGKINIPDSVLKKKSVFTKKEYDEMKAHPIESVKIISPMEKWFGKVILDAALYHHENYDGSGYPFGKKGDEINIFARIIRVVDSFDAMIADRPYRKALSHHKVLSELKEGRGKQYDPKVTDAFLEAYKEGLFKDIFFAELEDRESK